MSKIQADPKVDKHEALSRESSKDKERKDLPISILTEIVQGRLPSQLLSAWPELETEESELLEVLLDALDKFLDKHVDAIAIDREAKISEAVLEECKELGLFGLIIPEEHGGLALGSTAYTRVLQRIGITCASLATTIGAHSSIGLKALLLFGSDEQKKRWLPDLAVGERIAAFCLTEPNAGSDAGSIQCKATPDGDGGWILDGTKSWITNGGIGGLYTVFARTPAPEGWSAKKPHLSCFIVEREQEGLSIGVEEDKLGLKGSSTTEVRLEQVRVSEEQRLGPDGEGFGMALEVLNSGRLGLAGGCAGTTRDLLDRARAQASERTQFGRPIASFGLIQQKLGTMAIELYGMESLVFLMTGLADRRARGELQCSTFLEAAAAKVYCTEKLWESCHESLQIAGGNGFMREYPYERRLRDARVNMIFEGTNEILRLMVALHCLEPLGKEIKRAMRGIKKPSRFLPSLGTLLKFQIGSVGHYACPIQSENPDVAAAWERVDATLRTFPIAARTLLLRHGKKIFEEQEELALLADLAQEVLVSLASFLRCYQRGKPTSAEIEICAETLRRKQSLAQGLARSIGHSSPKAHRSIVEGLLSGDPQPTL
jgi:acyl-CoA dehydrogenase family member 9